MRHQTVCRTLQHQAQYKKTLKVKAQALEKAAGHLLGTSRRCSRAWAISARTSSRLVMLPTLALFSTSIAYRRSASRLSSRACTDDIDQDAGLRSQGLFVNTPHLNCIPQIRIQAVQQGLHIRACDPRLRSETLSVRVLHLDRIPQIRIQVVQQGLQIRC